MAFHSTIQTASLDAGFILAPERYDSRRISSQKGTNRIRDIAEIVSHHILPECAGSCLVLDTTHAVEGFVRFNPSNCASPSTKSAKKIVKPGDVIISRLRPYLRQVAYVSELFGTRDGKPQNILCSTEFYVLRSRSKEGIAFLVPFLLSPAPQNVFSASQEGGHHPRFNIDTLLNLPIPDALIKSRQAVSLDVSNKADLLFRISEEFADLVVKASVVL